MRKKWLSLILVLVMLIGVLPAGSWAEAGDLDGSDPGLLTEADVEPLEEDEIRIVADPIPGSEEEAELPEDPDDDPPATDETPADDADGEQEASEEQILPNPEEMTREESLNGEETLAADSAAAGDELLAADTPSITFHYRMIDENGNEVPYSAESGCYIRPAKSDVSAAIADGATVSHAAGAVNYAVIAPDGYFVSYECDVTRFVAGKSTSNDTGGSPRAAAKNRNITYTFTAGVEDSVTVVFTKETPIPVTVVFDESAVESFTVYAVRCNQSAYISDAVANVSASASYYTTTLTESGQTVMLYADSWYTFTTTLTNDVVSFEGLYVDDSLVSGSAVNMSSVKNATFGDWSGKTLEVRAVDKSFRAVDGYVNPAGLTVETRNVYPWTLQSDGSLASGNKGMNKTVSSIKIEAAEDGILSFDYKTSTNVTACWLLYQINSEVTYGNMSAAANSGDNVIKNYGGFHDWTLQHIPVTAGDVVYLGYYRNSPENQQMNDTVWIRNIKLSYGEYTVNASSSDEAYGSVTKSLDVASAGDTISFTATVNEGGTFYGWLLTLDDGSLELVSTDTTYSMTVVGDITIQALFGQSGVYAARIGSDFYPSISEAAAASQSGDVIVVVASHTVYDQVEIPSGVTLLLPYDPADTTIKPADHERRYANTIDNGSSPTITEPGNDVVYKVTVASGGSITIDNGAMLVIGGKYSGHHPVGGQTYGAHSEIELQGGATLNISGIMSCSGYIFGDGMINVTGGEVYQNFVVLDFHGGTFTLAAFTGNQSPFGAFTIINIRSNMTLDSASAMYGYCCLYASSTQFSVTAGIVGGDDALIHLANGTASTYYDETKAVTYNNNKISVGQTVITVNGDATIGSLKMNLLDMITVDTADFECPLSYNFNIIQESGTLSLSSQIKLMPGAEFTIADDATFVIEEGASLTVYPGYTGQSSYSTYPTAAQLEAAGLSSSAEVNVAGTLIVESGGTLAGEVTTAPGGVVIISEGASVTNDTVVVGYANDALQVTTTNSDMPATLTDGNGNNTTVETDKTYANVSGEIIETEIFSVSFVDYDDSLLCTIQILDGETPEYPYADPTREAEGDDSYRFTGWAIGPGFMETGLVPAHADTTYKATYEFVPAGFAVTIDNRTKGSAALSIASNDVCAPGSTFSVSCVNACVVAISFDAGTTYTELRCVADSENENTYIFTLPADLASEFTIGVILRGDANGNGSVNALDATRVKKYVAKTVSITDPLILLAADANGNGKINGLDATRIQKYKAKTAEITWKY